jgi:hypothetical protein
MLTMKRVLTLLCALGLTAASAASAEQSIEGFGKDLPFSSAVQQIVPQGLSVSYGAGIDPAARVSWHGGSDWQTVLRSIVVRGKHLAVTVAGNDAEAAYGGTAPSYVPPASYAAGAQADASASTRGLVFVPMRSAASPAVADAAPVASAPAVASPAVVAQAAPSVQALSTGDKGVGDATVSSAPDAPMPATKPMTARQRRAAAAAARLAARSESASVSQSYSTTTAAAPSASEDGHTWHAHAGQTLDQVLGSWADRVGWTLVLSSKMVYDLQASADFEGDFTEAAGTLIRSIKAVPQPLGTFYRGNKVLVVRNHFDQSN